MEGSEGSREKQGPGHQRPPDFLKQRSITRRRMLAIGLWGLGAVFLVAFCLVIRVHPAPWPLEVEATKALQGAHPIPCHYSIASPSRSWIDKATDAINTLDDPLQSVVIPLFWMLLLVLLRQWWTALSLGITVGLASGIWAVVSFLLARPRVTPVLGICVHRVIAALSFPSGHVVHDTALYGFLLALSLTRPVRQWRYRWLLLPLQVAAILYLLVLGTARLRSGEHLLFDVLGGYLLGVIWLYLAVFLFHQATRWVSSHREQKGHFRFSSWFVKQSDSKSPPLA